MKQRSGATQVVCATTERNEGSGFVMSLCYSILDEENAIVP